MTETKAFSKRQQKFLAITCYWINIRLHAFFQQIIEPLHFNPNDVYIGCRLSWTVKQHFRLTSLLAVETVLYRQGTIVMKTFPFPLLAFLQHGIPINNYFNCYIVSHIWIIFYFNKKKKWLHLKVHLKCGTDLKKRKEKAKVFKWYLIIPLKPSCSVNGIQYFICFT